MLIVNSPLMGSGISRAKAVTDLDDNLVHSLTLAVMTNLFHLRTNRCENEHG